MKLKRTIAIICSVIMIFSLVSCSTNNDVPDGMKRISDDSVAYDFFVYENWLVDDGVTDCAYYSESDRSNVSMTSYIPDSSFTKFEDFYNSCKETYKRDFNNFTIIEEGQTKMDFLGAYQIVYTFTFGEVTYKVYQAMTLGVSDTIAYVFTYMSSPELYDSHIEQALEMLAQVKFSA